MLKKAIVITLKILIFFVGWAVLSGVIEIPSENPAIWRLWAEIVPFAVMVIFTIVFLHIEKGTVRIPVLQNSGRGILIGSIAGIIWIGSSTGILLALRQLTISVEKSDILQIWIWILAAFTNVIMQELLVRGYIYQLLKTKYNLPAAIIVTTLLFVFMHGGAFEVDIIPVINVITMCLFTTALYESEKTILAPIMAHSIWNIIGAIILGGVSLAEDYPSILTITASDNKLLSGGAYGIEASIVVTILNVILMGIFYIRYRKIKHIYAQE